MKNKIINLIKKPFLRDVFTLAAGTISAQLITILLSPIITRLYGPEAYGIMGSFQAITAILIPISALSFPLAIVLPKEIDKVKGIIKLSLITSLGIALISLVLLLFFGEQVIELFQLNNLGSFLYFIPVVILFSGVLQVMQQWLMRKKEFYIAAKSNFLQTAITNVSKVGIGLFNPVASVLIFFTSIGQGLRAFFMMFLSKDKIIISSVKSNIPLKNIFIKYKDFPYYKSPELLVNGISGNLPILMLTSFFGPAAAGFYSISRTVLSLPSRLIGKSIGDVFYPRIAEAVKNKENITTKILQSTLLLGLLGIIPYGLIIIFGPDLFEIVFGSDWIRAGEYARWVAVWTFFGFMNRPSVMALPVLSAQRFYLIYTIVMLIVRLSALVLGVYFFQNDVVAIAFFGITGAILNIILITSTLIISKSFEKNNFLN